MPGSVLKAMWGDKYAERARAFLKLQVEEDRDCVDELICALEQAALEAIKSAMEIVYTHLEHGEFFHSGRYDCVDTIFEQLRARLAELRPEQEGKDAIPGT